MSDANEEPLLTGLLREIGRSDARLPPSSELESRMMARWDLWREREAQATASAMHPSHRANVVWGVLAMSAALLLTTAAAVLLTSTALFLNGAMQRHDSSLPTPVAAGALDTGDPQPRKAIAGPAAESQERTDHQALQRHPSAGPRPAARRPLTAAGNVVDFIPLGPMTSDDLSGSFQIVPVRIGNTPADVLLGEDGMARAIRVSSSDVNALWRSR